MKEFTMERYKNEWAIYAVRSSCYILFGTKRELLKRLKNLNEGEK